MSMTRTVKAYGSAGFSVGRQTNRLTSCTGIATSTNTNSNNFLGLYTTTVASASTSVLGTATAPTNAQVPVYELQITKATNFAELFAGGFPQIPGPVYCALSSTQGSYTATTDTADIFLEIEEYEEEPIALSSATLSSGFHLAVWTNAQEASGGPYGLYDIVALDLGNSSGAQLYLQLFACDFGTLASGMYPIEGKTWKIPIAGSAGENINLAGAVLVNLGDPLGLLYRPMQQALGPLGTSGNTNGTNYTGCTLVVSSTASTYTPAGSTAAMIVARYASV